MDFISIFLQAIDIGILNYNNKYVVWHLRKQVSKFSFIIYFYISSCTIYVAKETARYDTVFQLEHV